MFCDMAAYAQRAGFDHYDALVIVESNKVSSPRVLELARQANRLAKERGIPIYVVRPKFDQVINSDARRRTPMTDSELQIKLKEPLERALGVQPENIFICSAREPEKFDLPALKDVLLQVEKLSPEASS